MPCLLDDLRQAIGAAFVLNESADAGHRLVEEPGGGPPPLRKRHSNARCASPLH